MLDDNIYEIEKLINTFTNHASLCREENEKFIKQYKIDYPEERLPDSYSLKFCINTALACMCREISEIKKILKDK